MLSHFRDIYLKVLNYRLVRNLHITNDKCKNRPWVAIICHFKVLIGISEIEVREIRVNIFSDWDSKERERNTWM